MKPQVEPRLLEEALARLSHGGVIAVCTETFYGLLADASRPEAIDHLLAIKPREVNKGIPILLPTRDAWRAWVKETPWVAERLADAFWPGPLTLAIESADPVDSRLQLDGSIAVRCPGASPAAEVVRAFGRAVTATSANPPGLAPTRHGGQVESYFEAVIRAGELWVLPADAGGHEASSVVQVSREGGLHIAREGAISRERIEEVRATIGEWPPLLP